MPPMSACGCIRQRRQVVIHSNPEVLWFAGHTTGPPTEARLTDLEVSGPRYPLSVPGHVCSWPM